MFLALFQDPRLSACTLILSASLLTGLPGKATAIESENQVNAYQQHYPEIQYPLLKKAMNAGEVFLIDGNSSATYQKGHLPMAHSIADQGKLEQALPALKNYPIVVYCGGPQCTAWHKAADFAAARGYTNVMHYKGGLKDWQSQGDRLISGRS